MFLSKICISVAPFSLNKKLSDAVYMGELKFFMYVKVFLYFCHMYCMSNSSRSMKHIKTGSTVRYKMVFLEGLYIKLLTNNLHVCLFLKIGASFFSYSIMIIPLLLQPNFNFYPPLELLSLFLSPFHANIFYLNISQWNRIVKTCFVARGFGKAPSEIEDNVTVKNNY